jgi:hypothetical protein
MLMRYDFESSMRRSMVKHNDSKAGDDDMRVMRYERRTVDVGRRPRTGLADDASFEPSGCCVAREWDDD